MAIWMDLTSNLNKKQKTPFEVAYTELELAKMMGGNAPEIRFFQYDGREFVEVEEEERKTLSHLTDIEELEDIDNDEEGKDDDETEESLEEKYPLLKNAYNYSTSRLLRLVWGLQLYANSLPKGIAFLMKALIALVSWPARKVSLWCAHWKDRENLRAHKKAVKEARKVQKQPIPMVRDHVVHPFSNGDIVFSGGWFNSGKEAAFELVKKELPQLHLAYLVYDIAPIHPKTEYLCPKILSDNFYNYVKWMCFHCDLLFFTNETTREGMEEYQREHNLPVLDSEVIGAGSFACSETGACTFASVAKKCKLKGAYILAVGPLKKWSNYATLYRAMTILAEDSPENCPKLVIVGEDSDCADLIDTMKRDPRTKKRIVLLTPRADELSVLYRNAALVVTPNVWEGGGASIMTALSCGKTVLAADTGANRQAGGELVNYVDAYDPFAWAKEIAFYCSHADERKKLEEKAKAQWQGSTWETCAQAVVAACSKRNVRSEEEHEPQLYMDITLTWNLAHFGGHLTGIPRAELMLTKHLFRLKPDMKFFGINDVWGYQEIDACAIDEILIGNELDADFEACRAKLQAIGPGKAPEPQQSEKIQSKEDAFWFLISLFSPERQEKLIAYGKNRKRELMRGPVVENKKSRKDIYDVPFRPGDVVFTAGTGSGDVTHKKLLKTKEVNGYQYCAVIYDYTTILLPQVHQLATIEYYDPFLEFTSKMSDLILYGGETAQKDGIAHQIENDYPQPASRAIKFGSDISRKKGQRDPEKEREILENLGITGPFIMMVGTMEVRKNHETIYRAYLRMMEQYEDLPQLVFAGRPGWKTGDFLDTLRRDERVEKKILQLSPTDEELDVLYQNCEFTVLASLYEGWSLTLPESFWYGKFCLCCDTPALKETARDLTEYIHGWDEKKWAKRIYYYHTHPEELAEREKRIAEEWHPISWAECANKVMEHLEGLGVKRAEKN